MQGHPAAKPPFVTLPAFYPKQATSMNTLDIIFVCLTGFFLIRGLFRGMFTEIAAVGGVIGGFIAANIWYADVAPYVGRFIENSSWVGVISYALVFLGVIFGVSIIASLLTKLFDATPAAWFNHLGGGILGGAKGILICCVVLTAVTYFMPRAEFVRNSMTAPYLEQTTSFLQQFLPDKAF